MKNLLRKIFLKRQIEEKEKVDRQIIILREKFLKESKDKKKSGGKAFCY